MSRLVKITRTLTTTYYVPEREYGGMDERAIEVWEKEEKSHPQVAAEIYYQFEDNNDAKMTLDTKVEFVGVEDK